MSTASRPTSDRQHFEAWRRIFDRHATAAAETDDFANVWISSFSGERIPEAEIDEWVDLTCKLIRRHRPRHVLDIGCGTGLLLSRLAPSVDRYVGVDLSPRTVDLLRRRIADERIPAEVLLGRADDLQMLAGQRFDTFILNSVVQYFPSVAHLASVLRQVVDLADASSTVVIGDVRHGALLEAFHFEVALARSAPDDLGREVLDRAARRLRNDSELGLHPGDVCEVVAGLVPGATVDIAPKRGEFYNEMSRFRYDTIVLMGAGGERDAQEPDVWLDWRRDVGSLGAVVAALEGRSSVGIRGIPNRRTPWTAFADVPADLTVGEIRVRGAARASAAVDPEALCRTLERDGYDPRLVWRVESPDGSFDVIARRCGDR